MDSNSFIFSQKCKQQYWDKLNKVKTPWVFCWRSEQKSHEKCIPCCLKKKKKKKPQVILSALCHLLCNSTRPQHTLQMFADHCGPRQTIPWETINQGLLQPQGELYHIQTIFNHRSRDQLLEFRTSFYETISSAFLVQGNFKHTQFSREHWHWRDSSSQALAPEASAVSIELTWLHLPLSSLLFTVY